MFNKFYLSFYYKSGRFNLIVADPVAVEKFQGEYELHLTCQGRTMK